MLLTDYLLAHTDVYPCFALVCMLQTLDLTVELELKTDFLNNCVILYVSKCCLL